MYLENRERRIALQLCETPNDVDELAFFLTDAIVSFLPPHPEPGDYYAVLGALEAVKLELFRKGLGTQFDQREALNGAVGYEDLPQNRDGK